MNGKPTLPEFAAHVLGEPLAPWQQRALEAIGGRMMVAQAARDAPAFAAGLHEGEFSIGYDPGVLLGKIDAHLVGKGGEAYVWDHAMDPTPRPDHYKRVIGVDLASGSDVSAVALMKGNEVQFITVGQSNGQIAQIMEDHNRQIAKAFAMPHTLFESLPCEAWNRGLRSATAALEEMTRHWAALGYQLWYMPRLSKRARRRARGRAKAARK